MPTDEGEDDGATGSAAKACEIDGRTMAAAAPAPNKWANLRREIDMGKLKRLKGYNVTTEEESSLSSSEAP